MIAIAHRSPKSSTNENTTLDLESLDDSFNLSREFYSNHDHILLNFYGRFNLTSSKRTPPNPGQHLSVEQYPQWTMMESFY
jgi:hypothetical protein